MSHRILKAPRPSKPLRRYFVLAYWRDAVVLLRQFRHSLLAFALLLFGSALWLQLFYREKPLDFGEALYATLMLVFLNPTLDFPRSFLVRPVFFLVPILGVAIFMEAVIRFGILLFAKSYRQEEWQKVMASLFRNHFVLVGVNRVGYRVVQELRQAGEEVVAITIEQTEENAPLIQRLRDMGVPVLVGDPRRTEVLRDAQVEHARCLLICTENDLQNLEIALAARDLNSNLRIVMRLFSDALAEHVQKYLGVQVAFSTSAIAAPPLAAAALGAGIAHAFYVGDQLFHVAELMVTPDSPVRGLRVGDVEQKFSVSVILLRQADGTFVYHPAPSVTLRVGDTAVLLGVPEKVAALQE